MCIRVAAKRLVATQNLTHVQGAIVNKLKGAHAELAGAEITQSEEERQAALNAPAKDILEACVRLIDDFILPNASPESKVRSAQTLTKHLRK